MANIILYTTKICPYCIYAKRLLKSRGLSFEEIDIHSEPGLVQEVMERSGQRTVPQLFINDESIGGFAELSELNESGELDELL